MPASRQSLIPREGLTLDPILLLLRRTLINPTILLPLFLALTKSDRLQTLFPTAASPTWIKRVKYLLIFGVLERLNAFLSKKALNNWAIDKYDCYREIIVVTGGAAGIGEGIVKMLSHRLLANHNRAKIVVMDIQPMSYTAPSNVTYVKTDLSSVDSIVEAAQVVRATVGNPTVLINNAGVCRGKPILEATDADLRLVFEVNTLSHWAMMREFLPAMVEKNHGHIVTVASIGAYVQAPRMVDYNASKAAALSFHEGLKLELKHLYKAEKVRTTVVTQGYVRTPLFEGYKNDSKFLLPALHLDTVAESIVNQLFSGHGGHIVLPRAYMALTSIRGWFSWLQMRTLTKTAGLMTNWHGRQVKDPNVKSA